MNWRGKPLVSLETIVNLIGATTVLLHESGRVSGSVGLGVGVV